MSFSNWAKFAGGQNNGMRGVSKSKTSKRSSASSNSNGSFATKSGANRKKDRPKCVDNARMEAKWRAENDSRTLMEASRILDDPGRVKAAKRIAEEQARAAQEAAEAVKKL